MSYLDISNPKPTMAHYRKIVIPKVRLEGGVEKVVGERIIFEPCPQLKDMQRELLRSLGDVRSAKTSNVSHAFTHNRSIKTMATVHVRHANLVRIDIKDFFPSISSVMLQRAMMLAGYHSELIKKTLRLCLLEGRLPQGAPTSPFLSNVVGRLIDARMIGLAKRWRNANVLFDFRASRLELRRINQSIPVGKSYRLERIYYSRYADDLVFSSDYPQLDQIRFPVIKILEDMGFRVNPKKVLIASAPHRMVVCGITVNDKVSKPVNYRKAIRAQLHNTIMQQVRGEVPPGKYKNKEGIIEDVNFDSLAGKIAHIEFVCESQAAQLKWLLELAKSLHTGEECPTTLAGYLNRRRNVIDSQTVSSS